MYSVFIYCLFLSQGLIQEQNIIFMSPHSPFGSDILWTFLISMSLILGYWLWGCSDVFLTIKWIKGLGEEDHIGKPVFLSHPMTALHFQQALLFLMLHGDLLVKVVLVRSLLKSWSSFASLHAILASINNHT